MCSLVYVKAQNVEKLTNGPNNFFFFWRLFFEVKGRYLQNFKKMFILRSLWFLDSENFIARAAKFADFWELDSYKYTVPDRQHSARFQLKKSSTVNHSTLLLTKQDILPLEEVSQFKFLRNTITRKVIRKRDSVTRFFLAKLTHLGPWLTC